MAKAKTATRDIVVIGASAGGISVLRELAEHLPSNFAAAIFVVTHMAPHTPSNLAQILNKSGSLVAVQPSDGDTIEPGKIYLASPDHHLMLEEGKVIIKRGPKENRFRPSVDALFRSAAYVYGPRVIGVVLTGALNDGSSGLWNIKRQGGLAIVQSPDDAEYPDMPQNALQYVKVDYTVKVTEMAALLTRLTTEQAPNRPATSKKEKEMLELEVTIATRDNAFEMGVIQHGEFTPFTCPSCHGALVKFEEEKLIRYRCHTGHAYTASALLAEVTETIEDKLWQAMRAMEESVMLLNTIGEHFRETGQPKNAELFFRKAKETGTKARIVHDSVFKIDKLSEDLSVNAKMPAKKKKLPKKD